MEEKKYTTIYLVRHIETEWNRAGISMGQVDSDLTKEGIEYAKTVAQELKEVPFAAIYSSDLSRAVRTAEILRLDRKLDIQIDPAFRERDFGYISGKKLSEITDAHFREMYEKFKSMDSEHRIKYDFEGTMESHDKMLERFTKALKEAVLANLGKTILITGHGNLMRAFFGSLNSKYYDLLVGNVGYAILDSDGENFTIKETHNFHPKKH